MAGDRSHFEFSADEVEVENVLVSKKWRPLKKLAGCLLLRRNKVRAVFVPILPASFI